MRPKKLLTIAVIIVILLFAVSSMNMAIKLSDKDSAYLGNLTWHKSVDKGLEIAQKEDKPVFMYFWAVWCQFCEKFETITLPDPRVRNTLINDFVLVAIDIDEDKKTTGKYGVSYPPMLMFLDKNGTVVQRINGYMEPDRFYPILLQVKNNS